MKLARKKCCAAGRRRLLRGARLRSAICTRCCGACLGSRFSRRFCLASSYRRAEPRFVGFNLVMPEDYYVPMHDFDLHMRMIEALHKFYPATHVSLHAGELAMGLVPPEGLRFHIRESIEHGGAERIGHGVAVMSEDDPIGLLQEMAKKNVLVEICLTSTDV